MEQEMMEREIVGIKKDISALYKAIDTLTANVNRLTEFSFKLSSFEEDLREYRGQISDLGKSIKIIETHILGATYDRDIKEGKQDRQDLWREVEKIREQVTGIHLELARGAQKGPEAWWNTRISEWVSKVIWISLGGVIAWLIAQFGKQR